jgi:uncharacterized protein YndB with AHSA1/START domain
MATNTVKIHRVIRAEPELLYRAFLDGAALSKWLPPNGFTCTIDHINAVAGGTFRMAFTDFASGETHSFGGEYLELVPHELIRYTDKFDDPNLPGEIHVTITLKKVLCGTDLTIEQAGIPDAIPPEMCYMGWQDSLLLLGKQVEKVVAE